MALDPTLRIAIEVDTQQLTALSTASQQVASSTSSMAEKFIKSGLSASEAASALQHLGMSAREAQVAVAAFDGTLTQTATQSAATAASVTTLDKALASGAVRIASTEAGLGPLGFALARIGSASAGLAPLLAAAFPILAAVALVDVAGRLYEKLHELSLEALRNSENWEKIDHASNVAFESLDTQIDHADEKIIELTEGKLASLELELKHIGDGAVQMASKMEGLFTAMATQLAKEETTFEKVKDFFSFVDSHGLTIPSQGELARAFGSDLAKTLDTEGLQAGIERVNAQIREVNKELQKTPGDKQLREYADQLVRVLGLLEARKTLENKEVSVKGLEIQKEEAALLERFYLDGIKFTQESAKSDLEKIERRTRLEEEAARKLESLERANAEESKKDAREAEAEWQRASELRIHLEEEALRTSQRASEERIRDARAEAASRTAGLGAGPIKSIFEAESLKEQSAIASEAMAEAKSAAADYSAQLDIVRSAMLEVNRDSEEGSRQYKDLESQLMQLTHLMDSATASSDRWGTSLKQISAQQRELGFSIHNIGLASANAAQAGFQSFNSAFIRMAAGGESFVHVMQSLWSGMASSFISSVLKMFEEWLTKHIIMAALDKVFGAGEVVTSKTKIAALAGEAGAAGTASWAAAPWPIDAGAPAFGAAMAATAGSFALFEKGGIVKAGLHEGEAVLPTHLTTFLMTAAAGAPGGAGGPVGRGGTSEVSKTMNNRFEMHFHGSTTEPKDIANTVIRELRKRSYSF